MENKFPAKLAFSALLTNNSQLRYLRRYQLFRGYTPRKNQTMQKRYLDCHNFDCCIEY